GHHRPEHSLRHRRRLRVARGRRANHPWTAPRLVVVAGVKERRDLPAWTDRFRKDSDGGGHPDHGVRGSDGAGGHGLVPGSRRRMSGRHGRISLWFERAVLGAAMSIVAFVTERILLRALKRGGVRAAARTAAGHGPGEDGDAVDE